MNQYDVMFYNYKYNHTTGSNNITYNIAKHIILYAIYIYIYIYIIIICLYVYII